MLNKVLVVEDEQLLAHNLQDYLQAQGLEVRIAHEGAKAIGEAEVRKMLREKYKLKVTCPGDPLLAAEGLLVLDDTWPDFMRGRWSIEKVTASGKREESYRCLIEATGLDPKA